MASFNGRGFAASNTGNILELRVVDSHPICSHPQIAKSLKITRHIPHNANLPRCTLWEFIGFWNTIK